MDHDKQGAHMGRRQALEFHCLDGPATFDWRCCYDFFLIFFLEYETVDNLNWISCSKFVSTNPFSCQCFCDLIEARGRLKLWC